MARILVIEDNEPNLELMTYLLVASGHRVAAATDGTSGIALVTQEAPDLIVLDIRLPDMTGFDVLTALRAEQAIVGIPVVAVTANAMVGDRDHALAAGFDGYLAKPIEPATFAHTIDTFLSVELRGHQPQPRWANHG
jgi:two-component system, cell cycle response regulator